MRSYTQADEALHQLGLDNTFKSVLVTPGMTVREFNAEVLGAMAKGVPADTKLILRTLLQNFTHFAAAGKKLRQLELDAQVLEIVGADPAVRLVFRQAKATSKEESKLYKEISEKRLTAFGHLTGNSGNASSASSAAAQQLNEAKTLALGHKYLRSNQPINLGVACRSMILTHQRDEGSLVLHPHQILFSSNISTLGFNL